MIGPMDGGEPVKSYLDIQAIIDVAKRENVDAIHPGYGFLSENASFARACFVAGITFVGPTSEHLDIFGDKIASKRLARKVGVPTIPGTEKTISELDDAKIAAKKIGYPVMLKASFGGGGRGMRIVKRPSELKNKLQEAAREAGAAFGRPELFIERHVDHAKHIEVQILGDQHGNLIHLWERDCSVQRRHQKVVEIAPSVGLSQKLRQNICDAALRLCQAVDYESAGTVEFLVDTDRNEFYFLEVNPRIQVEHTVTEVVTGIDLVRSQILISQGKSLHDSPLDIPRQQGIQTRGVAMQCRITTEDPENEFKPDYGRLSTYRSPGGFAVRLDAGNGFAGSVITPYFDSLLVKLTTWGTNLNESLQRADRSLREFRIRGVKTNIAFLNNLILHPTFVSGKATTTFIDATPELLRVSAPRDRANKVLAYLGDIIVNGRDDVKDRIDTSRQLPQPVWQQPQQESLPNGLRQKLQKLGPDDFSKWVRRQRPLLITDTTMRDAHQSLLATRVRTYDLLAIAEANARLLPNLFSLEIWGGATFDTSMRFLQEDPWERLISLRDRIPNILFQMLLRGSNAVGYTSYPDNVVREFIKKSAEHGIDVFRVFDALNWTPNMKGTIETVRNQTDAVCEASICYTGDLLDPVKTKYSLNYYIKLAKKLVEMGAHMLAIKDMAGLCKPYAAFALVKALREEIDVPIHFHTHDTSGASIASVLRASDAGIDIADASMASMSGMTSQPCLNSLAAALRNTKRDTGLEQKALDQINQYWSSVRQLYYPFEAGLNAPSADVYNYEIPGGQYTNLRQQAESLGFGNRWQDVCDAYASANELFGDIIKVTPSSKVVGDMALFMVANGLSASDILNSRAPLNFPNSVVEMMRGMLGKPEGGWPKKIRRIILESAGVKPIKGRGSSQLPSVDLVTAAADLKIKIRRTPSDEDVLSHALYPKVFLEFAEHLRKYGDTSVIPTANFFYGLQAGEEIAVEIEKGKTLLIRYLTIGEPREDGTRTVFFELNGMSREVTVVDRSIEAIAPRHQKANPDDPNHISAPMPGKIANVAVKKGQSVKPGESLLWIEAMKMETAIGSPRKAKVSAVMVTTGETVTAGDLLVLLKD
jgi:pyruvate carboxylase